MVVLLQVSQGACIQQEGLESECLAPLGLRIRFQAIYIQPQQGSAYPHLRYLALAFMF